MVQFSIKLNLFFQILLMVICSWIELRSKKYNLFDQIIQLLAQKTRDTLRIDHMLANFTQSIEPKFHFVKWEN